MSAKLEDLILKLEDKVLEDELDMVEHDLREICQLLKARDTHVVAIVSQLAAGFECPTFEVISRIQRAQKLTPELEQELKDCIEHYNNYLPFNWAAIRTANDIDKPRDENDRTLLFWAVWKADLKLVKDLLKKGASINHLDKYNNEILSALHFDRTDENTLFVLKELLEHGADPTHCIINAGSDGNVEAVKMAIEYGANPKDAAKKTYNPKILELAGYYESDETKKFIEVINNSGGYCFAMKKFLKKDKASKKVAKATKVYKNVVLCGYHGGFVYLKGPVSVMDVLRVSHRFVVDNLDHYRSIDSAKYMKETEDLIEIKIAVDNFST